MHLSCTKNCVAITHVTNRVKMAEVLLYATHEVSVRVATIVHTCTMRTK